MSSRVEWSGLNWTLGRLCLVDISPRSYGLGFGISRVFPLLCYRDDDGLRLLGQIGLCYFLKVGY